MPYIEVSVEQNINVKESFNILLGMLELKRKEPLFQEPYFTDSQLSPTIHLEPLQLKIFIKEKVV